MHVKAVNVEDFCPTDPRKKYTFIKKLEVGLSVPIVLCTHSFNNNVNNTHFVWTVSEDMSPQRALESSLPMIERLKPSLAVYSTRAMRRLFFSKVGRLTSKSLQKPAVLRCIYQELMGCVSTNTNTHEHEIDKRLQLLLDLKPEDHNTIVDLRELNTSTGKMKYDVFWRCCERFFQDETDRR